MKTKIVVVSDSHGNTVKLQTIIDKETPFDYLIHCGDGINDLMYVEIPGFAKIIKVPGNVDQGRGYVIERVAFQTIEGVVFMVTHGDLYGVRNSFELLLNEGNSCSAEIILFGHTHKKYYQKNSPVLFNPGPASNGSYGIITLGDAPEFIHKKID